MTNRTLSRIGCIGTFFFGAIFIGSIYATVYFGARDHGHHGLGFNNSFATVWISAAFTVIFAIMWTVNYPEAHR